MNLFWEIFIENVVKTPQRPCGRIIYDLGVSTEITKIIVEKNLGHCYCL